MSDLARFAPDELVRVARSSKAGTDEARAYAKAVIAIQSLAPDNQPFPASDTAECGNVIPQQPASPPPVFDMTAEAPGGAPWSADAPPVHWVWKYIDIVQNRLEYSWLHRRRAVLLVIAIATLCPAFATKIITRFVKNTLRLVTGSLLHAVDEALIEGPITGPAGPDVDYSWPSGAALMLLACGWFTMTPGQAPGR